MQTPRRADPASLKELFAALLTLKDMKEAEEFLTDLCTPSELCDMADRWRVARLLDQGLPYREINAKTGVSTATVTRVARWLLREDGGYRKILDRMKPRRASHAR
jgi:TrpR-related protein YerC/YecD